MFYQSSNADPRRSMKALVTGRPSRRVNSILLTSLSLLGLLASGCSGPKPPGKPGGGGGGGNYVYLSGNWQFQATPTNSPTPFTALAGFINEQGQNPGVDDLTTAALQVVPGDCYVNATVIPMQGSTQGANLHLESFSDNGQVLTIRAKKDSTATQLSGTYSIAGGCADGATGNITGVQYANMTGTYTGTIDGKTPAETVTLKLSQFVQGSGDGTFLVSGTGTFSGISCFSSGTLASPDGGVVGSAVSLLFSTNAPSGAKLNLAGSIDPTADTLTLSTMNVSGGTCAGSLGTATLKRQ
jgi:hypothetical protein